jgi:hypothetical protein
LLWPLTVLMKQTRQAINAVKQSVLLRCLWFSQTDGLANGKTNRQNRQSNQQTDGWTNICMNRWTDRKRYGYADRKLDRRKHLSSDCN